jgi:4-amino-4-deoxy-L-arabinose transferase-like glycosyltransferase
MNVKHHPAALIGSLWTRLRCEVVDRIVSCERSGAGSPSGSAATGESRPVDHDLPGWAVAVGMVGVIGVALFFRLYRLDTFLHWAFGDEMTYGLEGQKALHGQYTSLFSYTWDAAAATYPYLLAMFQNLFGPSLHTGRMVSVLFGTLTVPLVALCARELGVTWIGSLLAAGLVAVSHWHDHFSRMMLPAVTTAFFLLLAMYTMMVAFRRGRRWLFLIAGSACGVAPYWFLSNRILGPILVLWLAYLLVFHFAWVRRQLWNIVLFAVTCTVVALPLALFWLRDTNRFMAPEHHVGVVYNLSYWSGRHPGESTAVWNVLWHQLQAGAGMFVVNGGPYVPWGGTYAPAMDTVTGWLLFPSLAYALLHWRQPLVALVLIWSAAVWFTGVVLTIDAPQMEHAVGAIPAIFLLIAFLADAVGRLLVRVSARPTLYAALAAVLLLISGMLNVHAYFQIWGPQLAGADGFAWQFYDAANYIDKHATPNGTAIYSWGYPDEFFRFLSPHAREFPGDPHSFREASVYIVIAGDQTTPAEVAAHVPGAQVQPVRDIDGDLAFTAIFPPAPERGVRE